MAPPAVAPNWQRKLDAVLFGYPRLRLLPDGNLLIADQSGKVLCVDGDSGQVRAEIDVSKVGGLACRDIREVVVNPNDSRFCAVATGGAHAVIWRIGSDSQHEFYPENGVPVSTVAFSPGGEELALGLGYYSLGTRFDLAGVEIWRFDTSPPAKVHYFPVPGICVDAITWGEEEITIASTLADQRSGFISRFCGDSFVPIKYFETEPLHAREVHVSHEGCDLDTARCEIASVYGVFRIHTHTDFQKVAWICRTENPVNAPAADIDDNWNRFVLTDGSIFELSSESKIGRLETKGDWHHIRITSGGDFVGVSQSGYVRYWSGPRKN